MNVQAIVIGIAVFAVSMVLFRVFGIMLRHHFSAKSIVGRDSGPDIVHGCSVDLDSGKIRADHTSLSFKEKK